MASASSSSSSSSFTKTHWLASDNALREDIDSLCLGTGRFLRSVLVPALVEGGFKPALIQTRGRNFIDYMTQRQQDVSKASYEVDTVLPSGQVETSEIPCWGAFSLGQESDKLALLEALPKLSKGISIIGVGVTEAGLASKDTTVMNNLYELLKVICKLRKDGTWSSSNGKKICIIDMDNVPNNGDTISTFMNQLAMDQSADGAGDMKDFLATQVVFLNTMVDRITSQREGSNGLVPRCEPIPSKALVVLDPTGDWPVRSATGVVVRSTREELNVDIALKLRVANGTHTAIAHALAISGFLQTSILSSEDFGSNLFMKYLDALVDGQIVPGAQILTKQQNNNKDGDDDDHDGDATKAVYNDWRQRLVHPHFGLSSFFITQNGPAKGGIRWGPTVVDLAKQKLPFQVSLAFAYAALLRWLTPVADATCDDGDVHTGWLDRCDPKKPTMSDKRDEGAVTYADGLKYNLDQGWYEYKCSIVGEGKTPLVQLLQKCVGQPAKDCRKAIREYLLASSGGDLASILNNIDDLVESISLLYARLVTGEDTLVGLLRELESSKNGIGFQSTCADHAKTS